MNILFNSLGLPNVVEICPSRTPTRTPTVTPTVTPDFCLSFNLPSSFTATVVGSEGLVGQELLTNFTQSGQTWSGSGAFPCGATFTLSMTCDSFNRRFTYDGTLSCGSGKTVIAPTQQPLIIPGARVSDIVSYSNIDDCPEECVVDPPIVNPPPPINPGVIVCETTTPTATTINGYAYYFDQPQTVNIPGIGPLLSPCAGGHYCNRTDFIPQLIASSTTINGSPISLNNGNSGGDRAATFTFTIPDSAILSGDPAQVYLSCNSPSGCHSGVAWIVLTTTDHNGQTILLFNSCVVPNSLVSLTYTCLTPTPTPTSEPTPTPTSEPTSTPTPTPEPTPACCPPITAWKLVTTDGINHGAGPITANVMVGLGDTIIPYWYGLLSTDFQLQIYTPCEETWYTVDSWTSTISLCNGNTDRYPSHTINPDWSAVSLLECYTSPPSFGVFPVSLNGVGKTFTGNVDNEWSNLLNWIDANGLSPAASLPTITDDVIIAGDVLSCSLDTMPAVDDLTTDGGNIGIELSAVTATISGSSKILLDGDCDTGGILHVTNPASFIDSSQNDGTVIGDAVFENYSKNTNIIDGNVELYNYSSFVENVTNSTKASCTGNLEMHDYSVAVDATIGQDALVTGAVGINLPKIESCDIGRDLLINANYGLAKNCVVGRDLLMSGNQTLSHTSGFINVTGHVICTSGYFGESSQIQSGAGGAVLNFPAQLTNFGISGPGFAIDSTVSTVFGDADLSNSINYGTITGNATFASTILGFTQANEGTVGGDATFQDCNNAGTVTGNAVFDSVDNIIMGNTDTVSGNAIFNGVSRNFVTGIVSQDATFNGTAINYGAVTGNATFNGSSNQLGTVTGTTTCNTYGTCP